MSYNPSIPPPTATPNDSALPIQVNFSQFASIFLLNHVALNDVNQGKHSSVIMQKQTVDPGVTEDLTALYCKDASSRAGTQPQLFLQIPKFLPTALDPTAAENDPMQLTYNAVGLTAPIYYSFLPGGYLVYFGSAVVIGAPPAATVTITLSPLPTSILCAQAMPTGTGSAKNGGPTRTNVPFDSWVVVNQTASTIQINSARATSGSTFLWLAIGKV